jgi:hypothetical protein
MPDRTSDLPPQSVASRRPRRSQDDLADRSALLAATLERWLHDAGLVQTDAFVHARALDASVSRWLAETRPDFLFQQLPDLASRLARQLTRSDGLSAATFISAFAHSLIAHAVDEVAMEARRAGHASIFAGLRPYLHGEPTAQKLADLGATLELSQAALRIALSRLRRRLQERIGAALALWASSPETRNTLRRQLRESLIGTESNP